MTNDEMCEVTHHKVDPAELQTEDGRNIDLVCLQLTFRHRRAEHKAPQFFLSATAARALALQLLDAEQQLRTPTGTTPPN